jgi:6-phosphogluconolactonase/glucosamine-6-phosphate isomerase/deaminase
MVTGSTKRGPLERLLKDAISTNFPASFLTLHPRILVLCDEAALPGA